MSYFITLFLYCIMLEMAPSKEFFLPFLKKEQVAKDTFSFYFDRTGTELDFLPGQYNRVTLPHENADERGTSRFFTIASSPTDKDYLMVTTKVIQSSFKRMLANLEPGHKAQFFGPMGNFVLNDDETKSCVLMAGGIGITPYHSMLRYAADKNLTVNLILFVSFSTIEEMVFYQELMDISQKHPNIKVIYTITHQEESKESWTGETGRISENLIKKYIIDIQQPKYYIVGPPAMVEGTKEMLIRMSIPAEQILNENFTGY